MRLARTLAPAILALALLAGAKPEQPLAVRFHLETSKDPSRTFAIPIQMVTRPTMTSMSKIATVTERDMIEILSIFDARDGSKGIALQLDTHGSNKLHMDSFENVGKHLFVFINGRHVTDLYIDRPVTDGIVVIPRGVHQDEIDMVKLRLDTETKKRHKKEQKDPPLKSGFDEAMGRTDDVGPQDLPVSAPPQPAPPQGPAPRATPAGTP